VQVNIEDVQPHIMEVMLLYMYGCLEAVPDDLALQLFSASDRCFAFNYVVIFICSFQTGN
jgi:hypothetical protein